MKLDLQPGYAFSVELDVLVELDVSVVLAGFASFSGDDLSAPVLSESFGGVSVGDDTWRLSVM